MKKIEIRPKSKYYSRSYGYSIPKRDLLIEKSQKAIKEKLEEVGITNTYVNNPPHGLVVQNVKMSCKSLTKSRVDLKVKIKVSL